jgi:phospholipase/carboxylesterase
MAPAGASQCPAAPVKGGRNNMELHVVSITRERPDLRIILCHGFGADNRDLLDLAAWIDPGQAHDWHFPQAPVPMPGFPGWAWFPRGQRELLGALGGGYFGRLENLSDPGLAASATELDDWIERAGLPRDRLVIGGFSQGSMVALRYALDSAIPPAGAILLSGSLIDRAATAARLERPAFPIFQSHGRQDPVLEIAGARALRALLGTAGWQVDWHEFDGGHEINPGVLNKLCAWLDRLSAGRLS